MAGFVGTCCFCSIFVSSHITSIPKSIIMGFPTKIQLIKRAASEQWYINFPSAVAQAMEFEKGEIVEWVIEDKRHLTLKRTCANEEQDKKKL
jgi:hypothetical protein